MFLDPEEMSAEELQEAVEQLGSVQAYGISIKSSEEINILDVLTNNFQATYATALLTDLALSEICESVFGVGLDDIDSVAEEGIACVRYGTQELADLAVKANILQENSGKLKKKMLLYMNVMREAPVENIISGIAEQAGVSQDSLQELFESFKEQYEADTGIEV